MKGAFACRMDVVRVLSEPSCLPRRTLRVFRSEGVVMRVPAAISVMVVLAAVFGCLLCVGGCRRPSNPGADTTAAEEASPRDSTAHPPAADSGESSESRKEAKSSADSSQSDGQEGSGNPTHGQGQNTDAGAAAGGGTGESASGSRGGKGASGIPGSDAGLGASPAPSGQSLPGRKAAVQRARDAIARAAGSNAQGGYRELVEAWQGLQGFVENDAESAELAARLLKEMERLGAGLDRTKRPAADRPLIAR